MSVVSSTFGGHDWLQQLPRTTTFGFMQKKSRPDSERPGIL